MIAAWRPRILRPHHAQVAALVHAACFDADRERAWTADEFASLLATPGCFGVLLADSGQPVGIAVSRMAADEAEILTIGVAPAARRRRGGLLLLSLLERHCARRGARQLFLEVAEDNPAARRLYEKCGFVLAGRRESYFTNKNRDRIAALVMRRDLNRAF